MRSRPSLPLVVSLLAIVPIGLATKFYRGWGRAWVNDSAGGIFYVIFWCLLFFSLFPSRRNLWLIPFAVFLATCGVEFLQLWHPPLLEAMRSTLPGRLLLGTTFVWGDFIYYAIGSVLGWLWLRSLWTRDRAK